MRLVAAASASAVMFYLSIGAGTWWPLAWLAPLPVLLVALDADVAVARVAAAGALAFGAGFANLLVLYRGVLPFAALAPSVVIAALAYGGCLAAFAALGRRAPIAAAIAFAAAWTGVEWIVSVVSPHGTAGSIAYSQARVPPVIALASVTGLHGVTFALGLVPASLAIAVRERRPRGALVAAGTIVAVLALGALGRAATTGTLRAAVIASDAAPDAPFADTRDAAFAPLAIYEDAAAAAAKDGARVIVLPERITAVRAWWRDELDARLRALADRTGAVIVVGVGDFASSPAQNRARVYRPHATPLAYAKHHLIPGLEDAFAPGDAPLAIEVDGHAIGVAICKDLDFEDTARAAAGVAALLVPAWDFTVDAELHDRMALVRGVEGGFAVVRAARTGWIAIHDAGGHTIAEAPSAAPVVARVVDVPLAGGGTPFAVIGRAFGPLALLCAIAIALALALGVRRARRR